jgi:hypothetical protein
VWRYGFSRLVALVLLLSCSPLWAIEIADETWNEIKNEIGSLETLNSALQMELTESKKQVEQLLTLGPALLNTSDVLKTSQQTATLQYDGLKTSYDKQNRKMEFLEKLNLVELVVIAILGGLWYGSTQEEH